MRGVVKRGTVMSLSVMSGAESSIRSPGNVNQRSVLSKVASEQSGEASKMRC